MIEWRKQYIEPERDDLIGYTTGLDCSDFEDMTVQSHKDDADINIMMRRYGVTGQMVQKASAPFYGDFSNIFDFHTALEALREAEAEFEALPSAVRNRFANDPGALIDFIQNPDNREEAVALGLIEKPPEEPRPQRVIVVPQADGSEDIER